MATKTVVSAGTVESDGDYATKVWAALVDNGDVGEAVSLVDFADRSVQLQGTFDSGVVVWEGSNDGTNYQTLTNLHGTALSFTTSGIKGVAEITKWLRPKLVSGVVTAASIVATLFARRT